MKRTFVIVCFFAALALAGVSCSEQGGKVPSLDDPNPSSNCGGVGEDPCPLPCEEGQVLDNIEGEELCVESCTGGKLPVDGICVCPEGTELVDNVCVENEPEECPDGQMLVNGICVPIGVCPEGQVFVDNKCVPTEGCPEGQALVDGKCVEIKIPVCLVIGQFYDEAQGKCVCPAGKVVKGNQCVDEGFEPIGPIDVGSLTGLCIPPLVKGLDGKCACPIGTFYDKATNTCKLPGSGICPPGFEKNDEGECVSVGIVGGIIDVGRVDGIGSGFNPGALESGPLEIKSGHKLDIMPSPPSGDLQDMICPEGHVVAGPLKINEGKAKGVNSSRNRVSGISVSCKDINALNEKGSVVAGSTLSKSHPGDAIEFKIPEGFALAGWMAGSTSWHAWDTDNAKWRNHIFLTKLRPIAKKIGPSGIRDDVLWVGPEVAADSGSYSYSEKNDVKINNSLKMCPDGEALTSVRVYTGNVEVSTKSYYTVKSITGQCSKIEGGSAIKPTGKAKVKLARGEDGKIAVKWKDVEIGEKIDVSTVKEIQCAKNPIGDDEDMALSGIRMVIKKGSAQIRGVTVYCMNLELMNRPGLEELLLSGDSNASELLPQGVYHYGKKVDGKPVQFSKSIFVMDSHKGDKTAVSNYLPLNFVAKGLEVGSYENRISALNPYAGLIDTAIGIDDNADSVVIPITGIFDQSNGSAMCDAGEALTGFRLAFDNYDVLKAVYGISCAKVVPAD
ncbi:MAG TPA: hypothetical protein PLZ86_02010 [bacterium]|nr:hypothetical protein [bacterium]